MRTEKESEWLELSGREKAPHALCFISVGCAGSLPRHRLLSSCSERGLPWLRSSGFSLHRSLLLRSAGSGALGLQQLWRVGSIVAAPRIQSAGWVTLCTGLRCSKAVVSSRPEIEPRSAALARGLLTTQPAGKPASCYHSVKEGSAVNPDKGAAQ